MVVEHIQLETQYIRPSGGRWNGNQGRRRTVQGRGVWRRCRHLPRRESENVEKQLKFERSRGFELHCLTVLVTLLQYNCASKNHYFAEYHCTVVHMDQCGRPRIVDALVLDERCDALPLLSVAQHGPDSGRLALRDAKMTMNGGNLVLLLCYLLFLQC